MISYVARKISKSVGIIYKASFFLFKSTLRKLYFSLVYPYLQYCKTVWDSTYPTNLNRIILLQKHIIRILDKQPFDAHTDPLFIKLKILKFDWIYLHHLGKFMYQYHNGLLLIPIHKKGSTMSLDNYRPISLLSVFNKLLEKLMFKRINKFISKHNILHSKQFGFRSKHSALHAILSITDKIQTAVEDGY
jgi:hypothetical protein